MIKGDSETFLAHQMLMIGLNYNQSKLEVRMLEVRIIQFQYFAPFRKKLMQQKADLTILPWKDFKIK